MNELNPLRTLPVPDSNRALRERETDRGDETAVLPQRTPADTVSFDPARTGGYTPADEVAVPALPTFAGYEIHCVLGRGGMGVVYKARHLGLNRIVALKMILAGGHADPVTIDRFRAEAQAVARFQHPNLVQVFDVGEAAGMPYFSLEYVDGGTLASKVARQPQPPKAAAEIIEQLARAMQYAHERGIAHRDLKPANILLTAAGVPKVTDFGLAKSLEGDSGQTQSGQIMGTPSYMAPEQAEGRVDIGAPADIYALGAILYDLLTGRPPFAGSTVLDTLELVRTREPVPPSELTGKLPRDLETICLKCLQKQIGKRYASALELADDLRRYLDGRPIVARPVGRPEKVWRWAKRNPVGAAAIALAAAVVIVPMILSILLFVAEGKATTAKELAQGKQIEAEVALAETERAREAEEAAKQKAIAEQKLAAVRFNDALLALREALIPIDNKMRNVYSLAPLRMEIIKLMIARLDKLRQAAPDVKDPLDPRTEAVAHARMGGIYLQTGRVAAAAEELRKALPILKATADETPDEPAALFNLANLSSQLADAEERLGRGGAARELRVAALAVRQKNLLRVGALKNEGRAKDDHATNAAYQVADAFGLLAGAHQRLGDPDASLENYAASDKAFAALRTAGFLDVRLKRSEIRVRSGDARLQVRQFDAAEIDYRAALAERIELLRLTPDAAGYGVGLRTGIAQARISLGDFLLMARKDLRAATAEYELAFAPLADALKLTPDALDLQRVVAAAHYRLGYAASRRTGFDGLAGIFDAAHHFRESLRMREALAKIDPTDAQAKVEFMLALARNRRAADAVKLADELADSKELDQQVRFQVVCGYSVIAGATADPAVTRRSLARAFATLAELTKDWKARGQLELDPDLDALRADPRFAELLGK